MPMTNAGARNTANNALPNKRWYEKNREDSLAKKRRWYAENRERIKERRRQRYQEQKGLKRAAEPAAEVRK
jgi:hypothetical protein